LAPRKYLLRQRKLKKKKTKNEGKIDSERGERKNKQQIGPKT
jgi:hypothetical protein